MGGERASVQGPSSLWEMEKVGTSLPLEPPHQRGALQRVRWKPPAQEQGSILMLKVAHATETPGHQTKDQGAQLLWHQLPCRAGFAGT